MTVAAVSCVNREGRPKERFETERAARRALADKHRFRNRRWPHLYHCPDCHGFHLTHGDAS